MNNWQTLERHSHAPYSGIPKACIVESNSGKFYTGVRIENISFPLTISSIQAACCICLSEGETPAVLYLKNSEYEQVNTWAAEFDMEVAVTDDISSIKSESLLKLSEKLDIEQKLKALLDQAVIPNSDFPVSALLFTDKGFFEGVNVEISEWSQGLCAERIALAKAVAAGFHTFSTIDIHTRSGEFSSPCGACRQVLLEHLPYHTVRLHHADGSLSEHLTVDLLPFSFKSTSLNK
ncbi:MAG: cytidine deaminase [Balneolaceae bacterium]|nr:cytidine deaminase [Balneolaceae bacterium]